MNCPICGARNAGRIGRERYYCGECCHEWTRGDGEVKIYQVLPDGTVERLKMETELLSRKVSHRGKQRRAG